MGQNENRDNVVTLSSKVIKRIDELEHHPSLLFSPSDVETVLLGATIRASDWEEEGEILDYQLAGGESEPNCAGREDTELTLLHVSPQSTDASRAPDDDEAKQRGRGHDRLPASAANRPAAQSRADMLLSSAANEMTAKLLPEHRHSGAETELAWL